MLPPNSPLGKPPSGYNEVLYWKISEEPSRLCYHEFSAHSFGYCFWNWLLHFYSCVWRIATTCIEQSGDFDFSHWHSHRPCLTRVCAWHRYAELWSKTQVWLLEEGIDVLREGTWLCFQTKSIRSHRYCSLTQPKRFNVHGNFLTGKQFNRLGTGSLGNRERKCSQCRCMDNCSCIKVSQISICC